MCHFQWADKYTCTSARGFSCNFQKSQKRHISSGDKRRLNSSCNCDNGTEEPLSWPLVVACALSELVAHHSGGTDWCPGLSRDSCVQQPSSETCKARSVKLSFGPRGHVDTSRESMLWDSWSRSGPAVSETAPQGPPNERKANITRVSTVEVHGQDSEAATNVVITVALWDSRLTRRPFSRWTAAASHCGYEEENRDERKHLSRLELTLCPGKLVPARQPGLQLTLCFLTFNCVCLGSVKPGEKRWICRVKITREWGCRNDGEMQPLPQPFEPEKRLFENMRGFSSVLRRREGAFGSSVPTYEFPGVSSVFTSQFPMR